MAAFSLSAHAATFCAPHADVLALLAKKYQEQRIALGVTIGGGLIEVVASEDGGTWTILVTTPDGETCVLAAGEDWHVRKPEDPEA